MLQRPDAVSQIGDVFSSPLPSAIPVHHLRSDSSLTSTKQSPLTFPGLLYIPLSEKALDTLKVISLGPIHCESALIFLKILNLRLGYGEIKVYHSIAHIVLCQGRVALEKGEASCLHLWVSGKSSSRKRCKQRGRVWRFPRWKWEEVW